MKRILTTMEALIEKEGRVLEEVGDATESEAELSPKCLVCWDPCEMLEHMFLSCRVAVDLWNSSGFAGEVITPEVTNFALVLRKFIEQDSGTERNWVVLRKFIEQNFAFVALLWRIWKSRNWVVFDHVQYSVSTLVRQYEAQVREWLASMQPSQDQRMPGQVSRGLAEVGRVLSFSCFVDGAAAPGSHGEGGLVVRDAMGRVCFVQGFYYAGLVDPFIVELMAFRDAIWWCSLKDFAEVKFCGDAKVVIEKVQSRDARDVKGGWIFV
ncbi:unnamed protein product [Linum trigynum]|uniref:RNase H type-1 domain-containing protein n=1 Tax=Linum trigynum TaxID=586398 RepID=A0AAV2GE19_9ROSI